MNEHFEIHSIRQLKNNADKFQAFVSVSLILRDGILRHGDKLTLGLYSCKIYDRFHVKRCNNCQEFRHYAKECPTPDVKVCGKCSSHHHNTKDCDDENNIECINCSKRGYTENLDHTTNDHRCPVLCHHQNIIKKKDLNMRMSQRVAHQW